PTTFERGHTVTSGLMVSTSSRFCGLMATSGLGRLTSPSAFSSMSGPTASGKSAHFPGIGQPAAFGSSLMHFWLNRGGQNFGPYTLPQLIDMATAGTVAPTEPVRHQYGAAWVPLGQLLDGNPAGWRHYQRPSGLWVYRPGNAAAWFDARPDPNR